MAQAATMPKARITVSLRKDTARFLKVVCTEIHAPSMSACIEDLISAYKRNREREQLNAQTVAYYDGISQEERRDNVAWGELGEREMASSEL